MPYRLRELTFADNRAVGRADDFVQPPTVELERHVAVRTVFLCFTFDVWVGRIEHDRSGHEILCLDASPQRAAVEGIAGELVAEVRIAAMADASAEHAPRGMGIVEHAAMLVPPVPREDLPPGQQRSKLGDELRSLTVEQRIGLMVAEQDHATV